MSIDSSVLTAVKTVRIKQHFTGYFLLFMR